MYAMAPTLVENSKFFVYLFANFFCQIIIEPRKQMRAPPLCYRVESEVSITLHCWLCSTRLID